jgi:phosphopentomutase
MKKRIVIIVLDSVGMGELPDAGEYGDEGSNTLENIAKAIDGFCLPNMEKLGLGCIEGMTAFAKPEKISGAFARNAEMSKGKDTTTGHWEMAGVILRKAFPTYPNGFPAEVIKEFEKRIGIKTIANEVASGTEIISRLGDEHTSTGYPIVYTSADSVFQIATNESVVPIEKLYEMCQIARDMLVGDHAVGRVIARPFEGSNSVYRRTERRKDFSLDPIATTVLDSAKKAGFEVRGVGKIEDIFNQRGITHSVHTHTNNEGIDQTILWLKEDFEGILFTNLVDFDMIYGHRNNVMGYADALKSFDDRLPEILAVLKEGDILMITGDHGCDPTTESTDHSREYTPLLIAGKAVRNGTDLGTRTSFADIAATTAEWIGFKQEFEGTGFLKELTTGDFLE